MIYQMKVLSAILMTSIGLVTMPQVDSANSRKHFGAWQFSSDVSPSGVPVCLILSDVTNKNIGQNIVIKRFANSENFVVDLYKDKWNRPRGSHVKIMFDFLDNQPLTLSAYADAHILDIEIPTQYTSTFLLELAERPALQVIFPDDVNEDTWLVNSTGARAAVKSLASCALAK